MAIGARDLYALFRNKQAVSADCIKAPLANWRVLTAYVEVVIAALLRCNFKTFSSVPPATLNDGCRSWQ
jgi:hypothetical protein